MRLCMADYKIVSLGDPDVLLSAKIDYMETKLNICNVRIDLLEARLNKAEMYMGVLPKVVWDEILKQAQAQIKNQED